MLALMSHTNTQTRTNAPVYPDTKKVWYTTIKIVENPLSESRAGFRLLISVFTNMSYEL